MQRLQVQQQMLTLCLLLNVCATASLGFMQADLLTLCIGADCYCYIGSMQAVDQYSTL